MKKRSAGRIPKLLLEGVASQLVHSVLVHMKLESHKLHSECYFLLHEFISSGCLSWNEKGNISFAGKTYPSSNIVLLLKSLVLNDSSFFRLPGHVAFRCALISSLQMMLLMSKNTISFLNSKHEKL